MMLFRFFTGGVIVILMDIVRAKTNRAKMLSFTISRAMNAVGVCKNLFCRQVCLGVFLPLI